MTPALTPAHRVSNLDLLRASAITLVVLVNAVGEGVLDAGPHLNHVLESGWIGVDLFFVLSGWLIGGLYWRERARFGSVQIGRFWMRRWLRTIPAYLVALFAVTGVRAAATGATDPFEWSYLVFIQNYTGMPYWAVSWSLCVEEHVYFVLPVLLALALRVRGGVPAAMLAAVLVSLVARILTVPDGADLWGAQYTTTHMRLEGIALGTLASWVYYERAEWWPALQRCARLGAVPALLVLASVPWLPGDVLNRFSFTGVDLAFAVLLVAVARAPALPFATSGAVRLVALTSYSIYMTHTVVLDAYRRVVISVLPGVPASLHTVGGLVAVGVVGTGFYLVVERLSLRFRERVAPRRTGVRSPSLVPVPVPVIPLTRVASPLRPD